MEQEKILLTMPRLHCNLHKIPLNERSHCRDMHFHAAVEVVYAESGSVVCRFARESVTVAERGVLIIGGNVAHRLVYAGETAVISYLQIDTAAVLARLFPEFGAIPPAFDRNSAQYLLYAADDAVGSLCRTLFDEIERREPYFETAVIGGFIRLIADLQRENVVPDVARLMRDDSFQKLLPAFLYANENYAKKISLTEMCDALYFNKYSFCKLFKKATGATFFQYLTELRLRSAERLLEMTDRSVTEIALECGFSTVQYFHAVFLGARGCSPTAYRKSLYRSQAESEAKTARQTGGAARENC